MDSLTCTAVFAVLLCASGVLGQAGTTGQACTTSNLCTATTDICESNICKRKVESSCASPYQAQCVLGAQCDGTTPTCKCRPTVYVAGTGDFVGKCTPAQNYAGGPCSGTGKGSCLDVNAVCTNAVCTCSAAYPRNTDINTCADGTTGQGCNTGNVCTATNTDICDSNICKRKVDATCASPNQDKCVPNAECNSTTTTCKCKTPGYIAVTTGTDVGKCIAAACSVLTFSVTLMLLGLIVTSRFL